MSKYVKELVTQHLRQRLDGVEDLLVVDVIALNSHSTSELRKRLRAANVSLMVVKNSLARRATEGTRLAPAFEGASGTMAICWGAEDIVALARTITKLAGEKLFEKLNPRGGVMDGQALAPAEIAKVSKWPSRDEQLSILAGQILAPGRNLAAQLIGPGGMLASQIKKLAGDGEEGGDAEAASAEASSAEGGEPAAEAAPA
jgi:large subunit ribosomal protein L10